MEIKNVINANTLDPYAKTEHSEALNSDKARRGAETQRPDAGDRASVSPEAKLRAEGYSAALSAPEVRSEAVAGIKAKIEAGEYKIDSQNIAAKMLQEEAELFS